MNTVAVWPNTQRPTQHKQRFFNPLETIKETPQTYMAAIWPTTVVPKRVSIRLETITEDPAMDWSDCEWEHEIEDFREYYTSF